MSPKRPLVQAYRWSATIIILNQTFDRKSPQGKTSNPDVQDFASVIKAWHRALLQQHS